MNYQKKYLKYKKKYLNLKNQVGGFYGSTSNFTKDQIKNYRKVFYSFTEPHKIYIKSEKLDDIMKSQGLNYTEDELVKMIKQFVSVAWYDKTAQQKNSANKDPLSGKKIYFDQFMNMMLQEAHKQEQKLAFNNIDTDGSGFISIEEMTNLLKKMGLPDNQIKEIVSDNMKKYGGIYERQRQLSFEDFLDSLEAQTGGAKNKTQMKKQLGGSKEADEDEDEESSEDQEVIIPKNWSIGKPPGNFIDWGAFSHIALKEQATLPIFNKCFELSIGPISTSSKVGIFNDNELKIIKITEKEIEVEDVKNNKKYILKSENKCFDFINKDIDLKFKKFYVDKLDDESIDNYEKHWRSTLFSIIT